MTVLAWPAFRSISKVAVRVALSKRSGQRTRAVLVVVTTALFTASLWGASGFWSASQHNEARDRARSPVMSFAESDGVPVAGDSLPILKGRQFQIIWIEQSSTIIPSEFGEVIPGPGQAFASPALIKASGGSAGFARRFGVEVDPRSSDVRWDELLAFADEYLAFATLPEGRILPARSWLLGFDSKKLDAPISTPPTNVADFKMPTAPVAVPFFIDDRVPTSLQALFGGMFLLVIPAAIVLGIGVSSRSDLRAARRDALELMGAPRFLTSSFDAVETASLSLPTAAIISLLCWVLLGHLTSFPYGSVQYLAGDLRPTALASVIALALVFVAPIVLGATVPRMASLRSGSRQRRPRRSSPFLLFVPVAVSALAPALPTQTRSVPFLAVVIAVIAVVPVAARALLPYIGVLVVSFVSPMRLVAGRRLQTGDLRASLLMRVTTFTVVIVVVASSIAVGSVARSKDAGFPSGIVSVMVTGGLTGTSASQLADSTPEVPMVFSTSEGVFICDCESLAALIARDPAACASNPEHIAAVAGASPLGQLGELHFGKPSDAALVSQVFARVESDQQNEALQSTTNALFGPSQVLGWDRLGPNPVTRWISELSKAAVLLLGLALVVLLINVLRFPSESDLAIRALATPVSVRRGCLRWEFHSVVVAAALLGAGYGLLICSAGQPAQITNLNFMPLAVGAISTACAFSIVVEMGIFTVDKHMVNAISTITY
ncbi:MAG: hypothetical protein E6R05_01515 [Candidatus Moraniibacteriota bacterium]|nr:MAG: hypothetical protein E6R05_01515 [Candidatus Moranbacteria bacterium]